MPMWIRLIRELDHWGASGATATFWWRDDDAVTSTSQLDALFRYAGPIPLALAVIPALATLELADRLRERASAVVLQHGWRHANHAPDGNNEYPGLRSEKDVTRELADGRKRLVDLFGAQALPVFVPPWHGFDARFLPALRQNGLTAISRKGPRAGIFAMPHLFQVNVHISLIAWTDPPSFGEDDVYLAPVIDHLRGRRIGLYDQTEPTGLLTHHLVQDSRSYAFIARLVELVSRHPAARWLDGREVFAPVAPQ
jgi:hypothetical protein